MKANLQKQSALTQARLRELLHYNPLTGVFTNRTTRGNARKGAEAGCPSGDGYRQITLDGRLYRTHRLAWFYMTGEWPDPEVDHDDGDHGNNRWGNLREATTGMNAQNRKKSTRNKSGHTGVCWHGGHKKWMAYITVDRKRLFLGRFDDVAAAAAVYVKAKAELHAFKPRLRDG